MRNEVVARHAVVTQPHLPRIDPESEAGKRVCEMMRAETELMSAECFDYLCDMAHLLREQHKYKFPNEAPMTMFESELMAFTLCFKHNQRPT